MKNKTNAVLSKIFSEWDSIEFNKMDNGDILVSVERMGSSIDIIIPQLELDFSFLKCQIEPEPKPVNKLHLIQTGEKC